MELRINGTNYAIADLGDTRPLLNVIRDELNLTGTKIGCAIGVCGACTVHIDGVAVRACQTPVNSVVGKEIRTIEGLAAGTWYFTVASYTNTGVESAATGAVSKTIN